MAAPSFDVSFDVFDPCLHSVQAIAARFSLIQPTGQMEQMSLIVATNFPGIQFKHSGLPIAATVPLPHRTKTITKQMYYKL